MCPRIATRNIQKHLVGLEKYFQDWDIKVNAEKTELITFRPDSKHCFKRTLAKSKKCSINLAGKKVHGTMEVKYLGIILDSQLSFRSHHQQCVRRAQIAYAMLRPSLWRLGLDRKLQQLLYKQIVRPIITYGIPAWMPRSCKKLNKLELFERRVIRNITGKHRKPNSYLYYSNKELYSDLDIKPMIDHIRLLELSYLNRAVSHPNKLINATPQLAVKHKKYKTPIETARITTKQLRRQTQLNM